MDTDDRLAADLARDLDGSFDSLVLTHQDRLYSIALRMLGDPRDAEEAAQDALVRAYRALGTYDAGRIRELRVRGWLTTIVLNLCRTRGQRRAGRGVTPDSPSCRPSTGPPSCSATSTACPIPKPPPPSVAPRARSRPRSTEGSPCYARCSRRKPVMSSRR